MACVSIESTGVDAAAIAAAVAAELDVPTAAENATAVAAAVPDATDIQAAAEAAIGAQTTTLSAAIAGGGYSTLHNMLHGDGSATLGNVWRSCVTAISDKTSDLSAAVDSALADDFAAAAAAVAALPTAADNATAAAAAVVPSYIDTDPDLTTGAAGVELIVGTIGQSIKVYGFTLTNWSGFPGSFTIQSCDIGGGNDVAQYGGSRPIQTDAEWSDRSDLKPLFELPVGKSLTVLTSAEPDPWPIAIRYIKD